MKCFSLLLLTSVAFGRTVNVADFGATGLGESPDDTAAFQKAAQELKSGDTLYVPAPKGDHYEITAGISINGLRNIVIQSAAGVEIRVKSQTPDTPYTAWPSFGKDSIVRILDSDNITLDGLFLNGNIANRTASGSGESENSCVMVAGSSNVRILNGLFRDCMTDGVFVSADRSRAPSTNVRIENSRIENARRNGVSGVGQFGLWVTGNVITGTGSIQGTPPMAGIDIEPDQTVQFSKDVHIEDNEIVGSVGQYALSAVGTAGLTVSNNRVHDNLGYGMNFEAQSTSANILNTSAVATGNEIISNRGVGIRVVGANLNLIRNNTIRSNQSAFALFFPDNITITGNVIDGNRDQLPAR
jgi:parallel beta-helix repeat protein